MAFPDSGLFTGLAIRCCLHHALLYEAQALRVCIFWDVPLCHWVNGPLLSAVCLTPGGEGTKIFRNVRNCPPFDALSHPRKHPSPLSSTAVRDLNIASSVAVEIFKC